MISICCWLWRGADPRRRFLPEHVSTLARTIKRTLSLPHRFICVTDEVSGFGPEVEVIKTPPAAAALRAFQNPEGTRFPSCYPRLWTFSEHAKAVLGEWIFLIDIDLLVLKDMAALFTGKHDFVGWRPLAPWGNPSRIGGGMYLLKAGTHCHVFNTFRGESSIRLARKAGFRGSDQAWLSYCLGRSAQVWGKDAGLYSIRDLKDGRLPLPKDAVAVQFNGPTKCWDSQLPWVKEVWY